ncbi:putative multidrug resistance transporter, Bcr/CflA family protein [Actinoplanes philippinensis]|uniref:MFS transporter, DHA1 family, bicyclomycin/chloramphenicol resistance protein n=1 Tax=Actinoplanes philippinensis TaxID=35752 RepID=A0A1I2E9A7_9ACTN|nr:putative multidrug resistance transporter, Bcr/CflA family protein [Actinoplanes philippinensis]SFE89257.1 MFS transporter, DHA1 family, bicyclomycin/chloramphenicol resistance protein [Actinoplanes philippinensis]
MTPPDAGLSPGELLPAGRRFRIVLVLGLLTALGPLTIDMYLPSLPAITADLHTTAAAVQLTLTGTLVGLAFGQLLVGPLSDAFGRRWPLLGGIAVHMLASVFCVIAPNVAVLGTLRVLQGLGAAAAAVVAMAMVRDLFTDNAAARLFSRLMLVVGVAPILAPTIGGLVLNWTSWRGVFVVLTVVAVTISAVSALVLPETLPPAARRSGGVLGTVRDYGRLFTDRVYVGLILVAGLAMAALFAYVSGSSYVFQDGYGMSEQQFALIFAGGAVGLIGATQFNVRLLRRWSPQQIMSASLVAGLVFGLVFLVTAITGAGGLAGILIPLWLVLATVGLAMPNAPALALSRHGEAAGTAAALLGAVQFGVGALAAPLVGVLGVGEVAMAVVVFGGMLAATLVCFLVVQPHRLPAHTPAAAVAAVH